jgi:hypothetical protein
MNTSRRFQPESCEPIYVVDDGVFYRVETWSEQEWMTLASDRRPHKAVQVTGLGWVGLLAIREPNGQTPVALEK